MKMGVITFPISGWAASIITQETRVCEYQRMMRYRPISLINGPAKKKSSGLEVGRTDTVHDLRHLVQFLGTDIRTVGESKVNQHVATLEILVCRANAVLVNQ